MVAAWHNEKKCSLESAKRNPDRGERRSAPSCRVLPFQSNGDAVSALVYAEVLCPYHYPNWPIVGTRQVSHDRAQLLIGHAPTHRLRRFTYQKTLLRSAVSPWSAYLVKIVGRGLECPDANQA